MLDLHLDLVLLLELEEVVTARLLEQLRVLELGLALGLALELELELALGLGQLRGLEPELGPGPQELVGLLVELQGSERIHRHTAPSQRVSTRRCGKKGDKVCLCFRFGHGMGFSITYFEACLSV